MLIPDQTVDRTNDIINDPSIYPWVCEDGSGRLDASKVFDNKNNVFFTFEHGGFSFIMVEPGAYDLHSYVLPSGRGGAAKKFILECMAYIFGERNAEYIVTCCPQNNRLARLSAIYLGFKKLHTMEKSWKSGGVAHDTDIYGITKEEFWRKQCQSQQQ